MHKIFFGYCHQDSVTGMLYDLKIPSFNTLILNTKHRFYYCCYMMDSDTVELLRARLMDRYCFARCRLSASSVVCNARGGRPPSGRARGRYGGRHCTAGQCGYAPLGQHLVSCVFLESVPVLVKWLVLSSVCVCMYVCACVYLLLTCTCLVVCLPVSLHLIFWVINHCCLIQINEIKWKKTKLQYQL